MDQAEGKVEGRVELPQEGGKEKPKEGEERENQHRCQVEDILEEKE